MTDHAWVAIHRAVLAGLRDDDVLGNPPQNELDLDVLADTIADHVYGAVSQAGRDKLAHAEQPEAPARSPRLRVLGAFRRR